MKKTITFFMSIIMVLNLITGLAFADNATNAADELIDILYSRNLSGSYSGTFSVKTDEALEFIDELIKIDNSDNSEPTIYDLFSPIDYRSIANSLATVDGTVKSDYEISENFDKIRMYAEISFNKPLSLNENLTIAANMGFQMYMDFDFSDISNPIYNIIMKTPINPKYIYINYSELLKQTSDKLSDLSISDETMYTAFISYISNTVNSIKSSMKANSTVSFANNVYTLKIDDKGFKNIIFDVADSVLSSTDFLSLIAIDGENSADIDELKSLINSLKDACQKFTVLGENGFTAVYKVDNNGKLTEFSEETDISINLYDISNAFDTFIPEEYSQIPRESWNIDIATNSEVKYTNTETAPTIIEPTLTNDNSFDFVKLTKATEDYAENEKYEITNFYFYINGDKIERDGEFYIPARTFAETCNITDEGILYNSDSDMVTLIASDSDYILPFETLSFYTNGHSLIVNGEDFWIGAPTFEENGITYIPVKALGIIGIEIYSINSKTFYDINSGDADVYTSVYGYLNR